MTTLSSYITQFEAALLEVPENYIERFMDNYEVAAKMRSQLPEDLLPELLKHLTSCYPVYA